MLDWNGEIKLMQLTPNIGGTTLWWWSNSTQDVDWIKSGHTPQDCVSLERGSLVSRGFLDCHMHRPMNYHPSYMQSKSGVSFLRVAISKDLHYFDSQFKSSWGWILSNLESYLKFYNLWFKLPIVSKLGPRQFISVAWNPKLNYNMTHFKIYLFFLPTKMHQLIPHPYPPKNEAGKKSNHKCWFAIIRK